ncbi:hypothetical protein VTP01DRAFT_7787 [Rhizomucor pusillus]|uniref:uncharacterized protein n=1 Tax=Rhizomucor pusillus TaxID=4840 RepID=UPI00374495AA
MPSDKYRLSNASRSLRHAAHNFFGTFNVGSSATSFSYAALNSSQSLMHALDESDAALADRRSAHNALERQRRENLNIKFQELAHALPSLQSVRRPSKTMIVTKSLEYVASSIQRETKYMNQILELRKENERLRNQATASGKILKNKAPRRARSPLTEKNNKNYNSAKPVAVEDDRSHVTTPSPVISTVEQEQQAAPSSSPPTSTIASHTTINVSTPTSTCSTFNTAVSAASSGIDTTVASMSVSPESFLFWNSPQQQEQQDFFAMMYAYQRDPLSTPVPPSYYYAQQTTIDPSWMLTSSPPDYAAAGGKMVADPCMLS